ncbi:hypothetical protein H1R20_g1107, partial [Candolleomyces eurysporus]
MLLTPVQVALIGIRIKTRNEEKDKKIGQGTYAVVYQGREVGTGKKIAIKKIKIGGMRDGLDMSAIREVKYLREIKRQNVIELIDVFSHKTNLNLVLEVLDSDLENTIKDRPLVFLSADIKSWMAMTFRGLEFCHRNWILHRALDHAYFFALPFPTHPSKLPKCVEKEDTPTH